MTKSSRSRIVLGGVCGAMLLAVNAAQAEEGAALNMLKAMTNHVSKQSSLSVKYDSDVEVVTPSLEKIQFSASGEVALSRPDKFRATRTGGYADVEIVSDGSTVTVNDRDGKRFAQVQAGVGFDQMVDKLRSDTMIEIPGADLLLSNAFEELSPACRGRSSHCPPPPPPQTTQIYISALPSNPPLHPPPRMAPALQGGL